MQSNNQVVILGTSIFEKWNRIVESNSSADQIRKKRLPSYFAVPPGLQTFLFTSGCVQSKNGVDLVEVISGEDEQSI